MTLHVNFRGIASLKTNSLVNYIWVTLLSNHKTKRPTAILKDCKITNCETGIKAKGVKVVMEGGSIENCETAIDRDDSEIILQGTKLVNNDVDFSIRNSTIKVTNEIASKVLNDLKLADFANKKEVMKLANELRSTKDEKTRKSKFTKLMEALDVAKGVAAVAAIIKYAYEAAHAIGLI